MGGQPLSGHVSVSGAKNSALVLLAATVLCSGECRIRNVPLLVDVARMGQVLEALGLKTRCLGDTWEIDARHINRAEAPYELVSQLRASFFAIGALLARMGEARFPLPGGCAIGARPVELHVRGLQAMGADVHIDSGIVFASIRGKSRLTGARIYLDYPSVGATETLMMAATLAEGETILENAAREPEIIDLANFCNAMGAKVRGAGTDTVVIEGVEKLQSTEHSVIPDRIEAGTFLVAAAATRSDLLVGPVIPDHMSATLAKLEAIGVQTAIEGTSIRVFPGQGLLATDLETLPFPGFPTDMQAQFMALLTLCEGSSTITETVFENRLRHVAELNRMGANIRVKDRVAIVKGVPFLSGAPVTASDLRAGAALVVAGLAARGKTTIRGLHHLDRGYENIENKLRSIGANIQRLNGFAEGAVPAAVS